MNIIFSNIFLIIVSVIVLSINLLIVIPVAYIIIGRKYDIYFKNIKSIIDPVVPVLSQISRTISYSGCIFFSSWSFLEKLYKKNTYLQELYSGYDFYDNAMKSEKIIANIIFLSFIFIFITGIAGILLYKLNAA